MVHDFNLQNPISIYKWAQGKRNQIERAFLMKGGWEGWLQVELGIQLQMDRHTIVEREQHVYTNKALATDMVITKLAGKPPIRTIIEFKCESVAQDCRLDAQGKPVAKSTKEGKPYFADRIEADLEKIGSDGRNFQDEYAGAWYICIGFSLSPQARDYLKAYLAQNPGKAGYFIALMPSILNETANKMHFASTEGVNIESPPDDTLVMWYYSNRKPGMLG